MSKRVSAHYWLKKKRGSTTELQTDPPSGTYNLEHDDAYGGEELEKIAISKEPFKELSCNSNIRTKLIPEDDRDLAKESSCEAQRRHPQSWRAERSTHCIEGARQSEVQAVRSHTSTEKL